MNYPKNSNVHDSMGRWVYYRMEHKMALKYFEKALSPDNNPDRNATGKLKAERWPEPDG